MAINEILPFATAPGANVVTQAEYAADPKTSSGFSPGVAESKKLNKVWRQSSFVAAGIAEYMKAQGVDVPDDGDLEAFVANLTTALSIGRVVGSITALRALPKDGTPNAFVTGYYAPGDGGGGAYYLDEADTVSTDNGGAVIVATDGGRWKLADTATVTPEQFGAKGDGTTDDTLRIFAYVEWLAGRRSNFSKNKIYRITQPISNSAATVLRLAGETPARITHGIVNFNQLNNDPLYRVTGTGVPGASVAVSAAEENAYMLEKCPGVAIIKCDGCNLIGAPDTVTMNGGSGLKLLENLVLWGVNGAKMGVYTAIPMDQTIRNNTFVLFEHFGYLSRAGITTIIESNGFVDCGWNLAHSGAMVYPATYTSGCAIKICSNLTAGDYTTIDPNGRATSYTEENNYCQQRGYTANNKSGFRHIQAHGVLGLTVSPQAYTGSYFNICLGEYRGYYIENYSTGGVAPGDGKPYCAYFLNCQMSRGTGYAALMTGAANKTKFMDHTTENFSLPTYNASTQENGRMRSIGAVESLLAKSITVGAPGTTVTYTFKDVITGDNGGSGASRGFYGIVAVHLVQANTPNNNARGMYITGSYKGAAYQPLTPVQLAFSSPMPGAYQALIAVAFNNNDLEVKITWGASWGGTEVWSLDVGMFGIPTTST